MRLEESAFADLAAVLEAEEFPDVDLALRRGRHIDRDDGAWYAFLSDAQDHLEAFYRRFGCELVHKSDGYFYLLPSGHKLPRRQLSSGDMLVGQALALLYLDPASVERGGVVERDEVLSQLDGVVGTDALIRAFNPKRKRYDERVAQQNVRRKVGEAIRRLSGLGFVDLLEAERLRLRAPLLRFAEPARGAGSPAEALEKLVATGDAVMTEAEAGGEDAENDEAGAENDEAGADGDEDQAALEDEAGAREAAETAAGEDEERAREPEGAEGARESEGTRDGEAGS